MALKISIFLAFQRHARQGFKGVFFQKVRFVFQISKKNYSKSLSWTLNLKFLPITGYNLFSFQAQDSDLEYLFFLEIWRCEKWFALSEKKTPLAKSNQIYLHCIDDFNVDFNIRSKMFPQFDGQRCHFSIWIFFFAQNFGLFYRISDYIWSLITHLFFY